MTIETITKFPPKGRDFCSSEDFGFDFQNQTGHANEHKLFFEKQKHLSLDLVNVGQKKQYFKDSKEIPQYHHILETHSDNMGHEEESVPKKDRFFHSIQDIY